MKKCRLVSTLFIIKIYILYIFFTLYLTPEPYYARYYCYHHEITYTHTHALLENVVLCSWNVLCSAGDDEGGDGGGGGGVSVVVEALLSLAPINRTDSYISPAPTTLIDSRVDGGGAETEISDRTDIILF